MPTEKLIQKYDRPGPRYTSYPPAPFWNGKIDATTWSDEVRAQYDETVGIDLYIHIPYCEKLCYYCGCQRTITKDKSKATEYVDLLLKEWSLYQKNLPTNTKIHSLHLGGGTPTFLPELELERLLKVLSASFDTHTWGSVEVDPRTCSKEHLIVLDQYQFKRISMGIQDFSPLVQKSINRIQSYELVEELLKIVRTLNFESVNFDLIYGLPFQTAESIEETISLVAQLDPDLIAFYSYAHLPSKLKNQRLIDESAILTGKQKRELYERGKQLLLASGMVEIGLDHFARKGNFLDIAQNEGKLLRNFMGHTDKKSNLLIGLGASSISTSTHYFAQNEREVEAYQKRLGQGQIPIAYGHQMNALDLEISPLIQDLMSVRPLSLSSLKKLPHADLALARFREFEKDGLVLIEEDKINVTPIGRSFLRNMAMGIDPYLEEKNHLFSQTI